MTAHSASTMELDYTQGFGSFYFASEDVRQEARMASQAPRGNRRAKKVDKDNQVSHTNAPFPLMKLPAEVRRHIFANVADSIASDYDVFSNSVDTPRLRFYLVDPGLNDDAPQSADSEALVVTEPADQRNRDHRTHGSDFTRVDLFDMYKRIRTGEFEEDPHLPNTWKALRDESSDYESESEAEFTDGDSEDSEDTLEATTVTPRYLVVVNECVETCTTCLEHRINGGPRGFTTAMAGKVWLGRWCTCKKRAVTEYNDVEALSKVSRQITRELGSVLWQSATLHVASPEIFLAFAVDRPSALTSLKSMTVTIECTGYVLDTATTTIKALLDSLSGISLRFLGISLYLCDETDTASPDYEQDDTITAARLREWAPFFKAAKVEKFTVKFEHYQKGTRNLEDAAETRRAEKQIERMWMPEALTVEDEVTAYLRNRSV